MFGDVVATNEWKTPEGVEFEKALRLLETIEGEPKWLLLLVFDRMVEVSDRMWDRMHYRRADYSIMYDTAPKYFWRTNLGWESAVRDDSSKMEPELMRISRKLGTSELEMRAYQEHHCSLRDLGFTTKVIEASGLPLWSAG